MTRKGQGFILNSERKDHLINTSYGQRRCQLKLISKLIMVTWIWLCNESDPCKGLIAQLAETARVNQSVIWRWNTWTWNTGGHHLTMIWHKERINNCSLFIQLEKVSKWRIYVLPYAWSECQKCGKYNGILSTRHIREAEDDRFDGMQVTIEFMSRSEFKPGVSLLGVVTRRYLRFW